MGSVDGEADGIHEGEPVADLNALGLLNSGLGADAWVRGSLLVIFWVIASAIGQLWGAV